MSEQELVGDLQYAAKLIEARIDREGEVYRPLLRERVRRLRELSTALPLSRSEGWQPIETMPETGQVIVCWRVRKDGTAEYDTIGRAEYLEIMGYGEATALGWMPLPSPPAGVKRP